MPHAKSFKDEWIAAAEKDPYAALGISLNADDRRILKRYRQVAKVLHPDVQASHSAEDSQIAEKLIARVINPAYQRLKQGKNRSEALATMRFRVRQLARKEQLSLSFESARQLLRIPEAEVDVFYENTVSQLTADQFVSAERFAQVMPQLTQLNLAFLRRKMGDTFIRPKPVGLVAVPSTPPPAAGREQATAKPTEPSVMAEPPTINYAEKYGIRAKTYLKQGNYDMAIQELREALKIAPRGVELHSMLGQAYLKKKSFGMARAHFKRVLELNPKHPVALKYIPLLEKRAAEKRQVLSREVPSTASERPWFQRLLGR